MMKLRKSNERGSADHGWLKALHSFSFGTYFDPENLGFQTLRVLNEDRVAPGAGFPLHGHRDMEIITYVIKGELEHRDSMGNGSIIRPGDVQRMSAGTGVRHSEFNPSPDHPLHLLQIWILPEKPGAEPGYEEKRFTREEKLNQLRLVASRDGDQGSVTVHQDAKLYASILEPGRELSIELGTRRHAWLQLIQGELEVTPAAGTPSPATPLAAGDGLAVSEETSLRIYASKETEFLFFEMGAL